MSDAIAAYHDLLASGSALAADSQAALEKAQQLRGLVFGTRPVCTVLRPRFLTPDQYRLPARPREGAAPGVPGDLRPRARRPRVPPSVPPPRLGRRTARDRPRLTATRARPAGSTRSSSPTDELMFTEFNTETPAGAGYSDALAELFYGLPVFQEFQRRFHVFPIPARPGVLHALIDSFRQWQGHTSRPAADRDPRLARGADVQRVRPLLRLLQGDGPRSPHRRSARRASTATAS